MRNDRSVTTNLARLKLRPTIHDVPFFVDVPTVRALAPRLEVPERGDLLYDVSKILRASNSLATNQGRSLSELVEHTVASKTIKVRRTP